MKRWSTALKKQFVICAHLKDIESLLFSVPTEIIFEIFSFIPNLRLISEENPFLFDREWGEYIVAAKGSGYFDGPCGVAWDKTSSRLLVTDNNDIVQGFTKAGEFLEEFGGFGRQEGMFYCPRGIVHSSQTDMIYICDSKNHRIQRFDSSFQYISQFGSYGFQPGCFNRPHSIAINSNGNILVTDEDNHRIQLFDTSCSLLCMFGPGPTTSFKCPTGITIANDSDRIYVSDSGNHCIKVLDPMGQFLFSFGSGGVVGFEKDGKGKFCCPKGICVDQQNNVYVADFGNNRIQVFNEDGDFLLCFGSFGHGESQMNLPNDVVVNGENVFVCDSRNNRIQVFK